GTGGASKHVKYLFSELRIAFKVEARSQGEFTYDELTPEIIEEYKIIVNCTPHVTSHNVDKCPDLTYDAITSQHLAYDLI
ncbi:shikimate dehydrogenase, partial [Ornithobacterium rhinotracheale]